MAKRQKFSWTSMFAELFTSLEDDLPIKSEKRSEHSKLCRVSGNKALEKGDLIEAIECYNKSLCYAPVGSENIPLVYGSRSVLYCKMGKYALAVENSKLARKTGYPADKMAQLDAREQNCKILMEKFGSDKTVHANSLIKLSHPPNEKIPFIAGCLELRNNKKYCRHIITNKDLKTGDIIAIEKPFMVFPNSEIASQCCFFCSKVNYGSLIPCSHCTTVMFCSEDCRDKATLFHLNEGRNEAYEENFAKMSYKMQLEAYRIAGGVKELIMLLSDPKNKTIFDFDFSNPNDPDYEKSLLIALNGLGKNVLSHENLTSNVDKLFNVPPINEKKLTAAQRKHLSKFVNNQFRICVSNSIHLVNGHKGIFLFGSLLNHSCAPNIQCGNIGGKLVSYVCRPIKAGEQLFCSYGVDAENHSKMARVSFLQKYQFKCDCIACINDWPLPFALKDSDFVEPEYINLDPAAAIERAKKNCQYIDENAWKMPCYEVAKLMDHNLFLFHMIADFDNIF